MTGRPPVRPYGARAALLATLVLLVAACFASAPPADELAATPAGEELVILVHGLGRTEMSMQPLARALEERGYRVHTWGYSSLCCTVAELGARLGRDVSALPDRPDRVHFVGHSLGNIVIRWMLAHEPVDGVGRVVMLAPPNRGSETADRYAEWFGWLLEPLDEITTDSESTVGRLPEDVSGWEVGVIAGEFDAKVSIDETHLIGLRDHVVVPAAHTFMMNRSDVQSLTARFLRDARFDAERIEMGRRR